MPAYCFTRQATLICLIVILLLVACSPTTLYSQLTLEETRINVPISTDYRLPDGIKISAAARNGDSALVVWGTTRNERDVARPQLMIARVGIAGSGTTRGLESLDTPRVLHSTTACPDGFVAALKTQGGFIVLWRDRRADTPGLYSRIVLTNGLVAQAEHRLFLLDSGDTFTWIEPIPLADGSQQLRWKIRASDTTVVEWWQHISVAGELLGPPTMIESGYTLLRFSAFPGSLLLARPDGSGQLLGPTGILNRQRIPQGHLLGSYILQSDTGLICLRDSAIEVYRSVFDTTPSRRIHYPLDSLPALRCGLVGIEGDSLVVNHLLFRESGGSGWVYTRLSRLHPGDSSWSVEETPYKEIRQTYNYDIYYRVYYWVVPSTEIGWWRATTSCNNIQQATATFRIKEVYNGGYVASTYDMPLSLTLTPPGATDCPKPTLPQVSVAYKRWNDTAAVAVEFAGIAEKETLATSTAAFKIPLPYILPCFVSTDTSAPRLAAIRPDSLAMTLFTLPARGEAIHEAYRADLTLFTTSMSPAGFLAGEPNVVTSPGIHRLPGSLVFSMTGSRHESYFLNGRPPLSTRGEVLAVRAAMARPTQLISLLEGGESHVDAIYETNFTDHAALLDPVSREITIEFKAQHFYEPPSFTYQRFIITPTGRIRRQFSMIKTGETQLLTPIGGDTALQGLNGAMTIATPSKAVDSFQLSLNLTGVSFHYQFGRTIVALGRNSSGDIQLDRFNRVGRRLQSTSIPLATAWEGLSLVQRPRDGAIALVYIRDSTVRMTLLSATLRPITVDTVLGGAGSAARNTAAFFWGDTLLVAWEDRRLGANDIYALGRIIPDVPLTLHELAPNENLDAENEQDVIRARSLSEWAHGDTSTIRSLSPWQHGDTLEIWPFPCRERIECSVRMPIAGRVRFSLISTSGEVVQVWDYWMSPGKQRIALNLEHHRIGWYRLVLYTQHTTMSAPVIIE